MKPFYKRSKFWLAVISAVSIIAVKGFGINLDTEEIISIASVILGYIFGQSIVDRESAKQGKY